MHIDKFGQQIFTEEDLCNLYLINPSFKTTKILVDKRIHISDIIEIGELPKFIEYKIDDLTVKQFDENLQQKWLIPVEYKNIDIAQYVLSLCKNDEELQRAGTELLMFQERNMFPLLVYLKYLVETLKKNNIVYGVGRGSSVSSFVLFLLGVHRINSLYYDLSIDEFLK